MPFAITPKGAGNPVGFRKIEQGWDLAPGEAFTVDVPSVDGLVLHENGRQLREERPADTASRKGARVDAAAKATLRSPNAESRTTDAIIGLLIDDIAELKGMDPAAYRDDIEARLKALA